jgi:acyl carrier protein
MLQVVADKTGYPADMIELDMELEGDLGIDSIKRVEILAAVQERAPGLPEIDAAQMASLQTLRAIVDVLGQQLGGAAAAHAQPTHAVPSGGPLEAAKTAKAGPRLGRFRLDAVPARRTGLAMAGLFDGEVWITGDSGSTADELAALLKAEGIDARATHKPPEDARAVVFLGGLRDVATIDEALAIHREAFSTARGLAPQLQREGGLFVTVQDTGGRFGLSEIPGLRAWLGGLSALAKTAALEWPSAAVKSIDLERAGRGARALAEGCATSC